MTTRDDRPRVLTLHTQGSDVSQVQGCLLDIGANIATEELGAALFGLGTRKAVLEFQQKLQLPVTGTVDETTADALRRHGSTHLGYRVLGTVRHPNGRPAGKLTVRAFDRDLRQEQELGETTVDGSGFYQIVYTDALFRRAEGRKADLLMRVFDDQRMLYDTPIEKIVFNAPAVTVIDIDLVDGDTHRQSQYEAIVAAVTPLLDGVAPDALQEDARHRDITFLAGETAQPSHNIAHFAVAQKLAKTTGITAEFFYALFALDILLKAGLDGAAGVRFDIDLATDREALYYDIVLLPAKTVGAALKRAVKNHVVSASLLDQLDTITERLARNLPEAQAWVSQQRPRVLLGQLERFFAAGKQTQVLDILQQDSFGNLPELFRRLQDAAAFKEPADANRAAVGATLADLLGYDDQIVDGIRRAQNIERPEDVRQLARLNRAGWSALLQRTVGSLQVGDRPLRKELVDLHASALVRKMEKRYPTTAFGAQLERDRSALPAQRDALLGLLAEHPDFDLAAGNIDLLLKKSPTHAKAKQALKATQRVFKVAPTFRQAKALLDGGVRSAADIHALGAMRFVKRFAKPGVFTREQARETFGKASDIHTASALLAGELQATSAAMHVTALAKALAQAKLDAVTRDFPNMKSLFQLADYCACEECRSVHSAAAYVVDTLQFLGNRLVVDTTGGPASVKIARDVLFERRPDLGDTDLDCDNTNTPLQYIDVVCELLEEAVAPDPGFAFNGALASGVVPAGLLAALQANGLPFTTKAAVYDADLTGHRIVRDANVVCKLTPDGGPNAWRLRRLRQTRGTAEELAAAPQYLNADTYTALNAARFAFALPFDLAHEETRSYFAQFDVSRADLMDALRITAGPQDNEIAAEDLGLSDAHRQLIVSADPADQATYWNTGATPAATAMKVVDSLITQAGIDYTTLQELLGRTWLNPGATMFIRQLDNSCNLAKKEIQNLDDNTLDRLHRFIRLTRKTGWASADLDRAIRAPRLGNGVLDDACLVRIRQIGQLRAKLDLPVSELCNLYATLEADGDGSRYAQLFLNLSANGALNEDFRLANVRQNVQDEANVPGSGKKLSAYIDYLALCLGAPADETGRLVAALAAPAILSEANIAAVYARNILARTLHLKPTELLILESLTGIDTLLSPADTMRFLDKLAKVRASGTSPADLQYLLVHQADNLSDRELGDAAIGTLLSALQAGYQLAYADHRSPFSVSSTADENKVTLADLLATLPDFSTADLARFQALVDDAWVDPIVTPAQFIDQKLQKFVDTAPIKAAQAALAGAVAPKEAERNALIRSVADALSRSFYVSAKNELLVAAMVKAFKLDEDIATAVLQHARLKEPAAAGKRTVIDLLTDEALVDTVNVPAVPPAITPAAFDNQYRALRLLQAMTALLGALKLDAEQVGWMLTNNPVLGWMEPDKLTYQAGIAPVTFDAWERLQDALHLVHAYPPVANPADAAKPLSVYGLFELVLKPGALIADVLAYGARLTGWDPAVLAALDARFGLSAVDLTAYRLAGTWLRLEPPVTLLRTLGLDVASGLNLIKPQLLAADAARMRQALKARYADSEWLGVLRNVQDPLRQQKRDALVAFLLGKNATLKTADDLYDYFLIDVEMCSCMPTSRIVQAHATIQLFVQRCLMGLEPRSVASVKQDAGWAQWRWMANFRVWEANRKIFLYPENWIEPELRDDKSELFVQVEDTLQQNELTDQAVEDAAVSYLEKLDDIAQMDVMASYYQTDIATMHVFARTKGGDPAVYYYRQFQKERYWTPWEKVDLDIVGDHLLAFDRNSRLTLAWPVFTEETDSSQVGHIPGPGDIPAGGKDTNVPQKRWKIQLAVSERSGEKWMPKKVSKGAIYSPQGGYFYSLPAAQTYNFFVWGLGAAGQAVSCSNTGGTGWVGSFALTGCKGYPEPQPGGAGFPATFLPQFKDSALQAERFTELNQDATNDLAIRSIFNLGAFDTIVNDTPGIFKVTYPMQMSVIDWILLGLELYLGAQNSFAASYRERGLAIPLGTFMPYFYGDVTRTYAIIPGFYEREAKDPRHRIEKTFSDIDQLVLDVLALVTKYLQIYQNDPAHDLAKLIQTLLVDPEYLRLKAEWAVYKSLQFGLKFSNFYHPLICLLRSTLNREGIPALMQRDLQLTTTPFDFAAVYKPSALVVKPYPREDVDFERDGAYAGYNWELFFHMPFEIAMRLNRDQRFEEARDWFHYIFNPVGATDAPAPQRFWVTKPFFQTTLADYQEQAIDSIMNAIAADPSGASITNLKFAVSEWRDKPFRPHVVARSRPVAYQLAVVTKYIQNLIDWGDNLFRQFTRESVTQATQLYILADKLLGPKPRIVAPLISPPPETYNQLQAKIDLFGNALLDLENMIPDLGLLPHGGAELPPAPMTVSALYFCVPPNEKMLEYWDLVADRLFKIRHCQNIDGVESILALFSPPIDPGALVRAVAGGLDISSFVAGLGAPLPNYRFSVMSQKATELVQQVSALGNAMLAALEKRDAESLARLRSEQEIAVLKAVRAVKVASIAEAQGALEGLNKSRKVTEERRAYYAGQSYMNAWEITAVALSGGSLIGEAAIALGYILSGGLKLIPDFMTGGAGFGGSPTVTLTIGGSSTGASADSAVQTISSIARALDKAAAMAATQGSYQRRQDEWDFQVRLADKELVQIDQQIATANLHLDMLAKDVAAHDVQVANARQTDAYMHSKYTRQELYDWMIGRISSVYFKAYQLAFDVAKKAERCFGHELGGSANFIAFGYWDSLQKGLMSADALLHDIKRMEAAYLDQNKREYELTKHLSLLQLDPAALIQLKTTGRCVVQVPETAFDLDHPGHYMRRHKSVSLSIPCVAGPYTSVSCKLSLISNRYRKSTALRQGAATDKAKYQEQAGNDERFVYNVGSIQSIATSSGQSDSGMFELNFRDDRYLPFEGTGTIATWLIEMPDSFRQFDYDTISDVILHLRYTARDGGSSFRTLVDGVERELLDEMTLAASRSGLYQAYNLRQQFPNEWYSLQQTMSATLTIGPQHLPYFVRSHGPVVDSVTWFARVDGDPAVYVMSLDAVDFNLKRNFDLGRLCVGTSATLTLETAFTLAATDTSKLKDLTLLVHYSIGS
ncbi:neuraminidase-like domain-containing protein [Cupriavidus lacunae]|nr:neuraminidase-like domain-containing protein [Cupriavidus lacunae]